MDGTDSEGRNDRSNKGQSVPGWGAIALLSMILLVMIIVTVRALAWYR
jgi:hypothetical protein